MKKIFLSLILFCSLISFGQQFSSGGAPIPSTGEGSVTTVTVTPANGVSGTVSNPTTTPSISISLGAITPTSVNGNTIATGTGKLALSSYTLTAAGTATVSGINTGDQTTISGNAGTVTTNANLTGDVTSIGNATTLAASGVSAATYGSATATPSVTIDAKGRVTAASNVTITPAIGSITGLGSNVSTFLATPSSANFLSAITDESGSGVVMGNNTPTILTPSISPTGFTNAQHAHTGATSGGQLTMASISDLPTITTGTYTPTCSAISNTDAVSVSSGAVFFYTSITYSGGPRVITVSGFLSIDLTAATTNSEVDITLPVASTFSTAFDAVGSFTAGNSFTGQVFAESSGSHRARCTISSQTSTAANNYSITFSYTVK